MVSLLKIVIDAGLAVDAATCRETLAGVAVTDDSMKGIQVALDILLPRLVGEESPARKLLGMEGTIDASEADPKELVPVMTIVTQVRTLAGTHGHHALDEAHFLLAISALHPEAFTAFLRRCAAAYLTEHPDGTARQRELIAFAERVNYPEGAAQVRQEIQQTPINPESVKAKLTAYLASSYYPYGEAEWQRFLAQHEALEASEKDVALSGLLAHKRSEHDLDQQGHWQKLKRLLGKYRSTLKGNG